MAERLTPGHDDEKAQAAIAAARHLASARGRLPGVADYLTYRTGREDALPSVTVIYRVFHSWDMFLAAAGVAPADPPPPSLHALTTAMTVVAHALGTTVLSARAYDTQRHIMERPLPSSSVIRRWFGSWEVATQHAGLSTPNRPQGEDYGNG